MAFPTGPRNLSLRAVGPPQVQSVAFHPGGQHPDILWRSSSGQNQAPRLLTAQTQLPPCSPVLAVPWVLQEVSYPRGAFFLVSFSRPGTHQWRRKEARLACLWRRLWQGRPAVLRRAACPAQGLRSLPQGSAPAPARQQPWPAGASSGIRPLEKAALRSYKRTAAGGFWPCLPTPAPAGSLGASSLWTVDTS